MNGIVRYGVFCDWLLSLRVMFSRFVHIVVHISASPLCVTERCSMVQADHILFIHSSVDGYLGCFNFLALSDAAVNLRVLHLILSPPLS